MSHYLLLFNIQAHEHVAATSSHYMIIVLQCQCQYTYTIDIHCYLSLNEMTHHTFCAYIDVMIIHHFWLFINVDLLMHGIPIGFSITICKRHSRFILKTKN